MNIVRRRSVAPPVASASVAGLLLAFSAWGPSACTNDGGDAIDESPVDAGIARFAADASVSARTSVGDGSAESMADAAEAPADADVGCVDHGTYHPTHSSWACVGSECNTCSCWPGGAISGTLIGCASVVLVPQPPPCPSIGSVNASPSVLVGDQRSTISVMVTGDAAVAWSATSGTFTDASATTTQYSCSDAGTQPVVTVQLAAPADAACSGGNFSRLSFPIECASTDD
jgi:hypothetical protein